MRQFNIAILFLRDGGVMTLPQGTSWCPLQRPVKKYPLTSCLCRSGAASLYICTDTLPEITPCKRNVGSWDISCEMLFSWQCNVGRTLSCESGGHVLRLLKTGQLCSHALTMMYPAAASSRIIKILPYISWQGIEVWFHMITDTLCGNVDLYIYDWLVRPYFIVHHSWWL